MNKYFYRLAISFAVVLSVSGVYGQGVPAPYTIRLQRFIAGLSSPIFYRDDGPGAGKKTFIVQQGGIIRVLQAGSRTPTDFINLTTRVTSGGERGLLGMTVHPDFDTNGKFYVNYTRSADGATVIAEYKTVTGNPDQGDFNSERVLLVIPQPFSNHNGGMIEFGAISSDRTYLYIGMGDGGSANDPGNRAQNRSQLLGKMLRIDPNIPDGSPVPYLIPPTNPFTGAGTARCDNGSTTSGGTCQEIWTIGMRNPWRWSFDRADGQLWAADVGQGAQEEVDIITGGANYGWRVYEGASCTGLDPSLCIPANYTMPIFQYGHTGGRCSITGGYVYRGTQGSLPFGSYIFADYCTAEMMLWTGASFQLLLDLPTGNNIITFGQDENNELYVSHGTTISRITRAKASADFDGDLKTDMSVFRPSTGVWYAVNSSNGTFRIQAFGQSTDIPAVEDYDGDNISDIGVFRPSTGDWHYYRSSDNVIATINFGLSGDIPAAADYDGDAKADLAIFRPSTGTWWIRRSSDPGNFFAQRWGVSGDLPVVGDYDGDGKFDLAVWRPSTGTWYWVNSNGSGTAQVTWGLDTDITAQGDFDNDGKTDIAVFRPSNGVWYIQRSFGGTVQYTNWGLAGDVPVVGDYDGDGIDDLAVYRPSNGVWYRLNSSTGQAALYQFGLADDLAAPKYDAP
ncbi:MAG TPA: PQQ-dependent sugar dehydrogenase [Pyrinomonadaceae bacterium]|nr:PQQ-dependent sugar dehydrogenase [Pyrinomonadaceae bacterium]